MIVNILDKIDSVMYYPVLIIILVFGGLYFTIRTRFVQIRQFKESCRLIMEPPTPPQKTSSFQAMIVSTASRVGTGNIVGVSSAICLGGPGAVFWMWLMCIVGASSAFTESTLAQIDFCRWIPFAEGLQASAVVIVAVGQNGKIHFPQVHAQLRLFLLLFC